MYTSPHFNLINYEIHHLEKCSMTSAHSIFTKTSKKEVATYLAVKSTSTG